MRGRFGCHARCRVDVTKPLRADAKRNREALIVAARQVFETGDEIRFDDFARRAGVGTGTLYRHFPTQDALVAAVYQEEVATLCQRAQEHWSKDGSRRTQVRDVLSRVVASQAAPFSAEELRTHARAIDKGISYASIYRTLASLVSAGLLREITGPNDLRCYTLIDSKHTGVSNIVCTDCERVVPMNDDCLPLREGFLARQLGFNPQKMSLRIEASCEELRQHGACTKRKTKAS